MQGRRGNLVTEGTATSSIEVLLLAMTHITAPTWLFLGLQLAACAICYLLFTALYSLYAIIAFIT